MENNSSLTLPISQTVTNGIALGSTIAYILQLIYMFSMGNERFYKKIIYGLIYFGILGLIGYSTYKKAEKEANNIV